MRFYEFKRGKRRIDQNKNSYIFQFCRNLKINDSLGEHIDFLVIIHQTEITKLPFTD